MCVYAHICVMFTQLSIPPQVIGEGMAKKVYLTYSKITNNGMKEKT